MNAEKKQFYKNFFIKYAIFFGILTVVFLITIYSVILSRKSWQNNLKVCIEKVLDENEPNTWTIEEHQYINNPFSLSAICYSVRNRKTGEQNYAVLLRITTFYGPLPAVFIANNDGNVHFVGYSSLHGRVNNLLTSKSMNKRVEYWQKQITQIIEIKK